MLINAYWLKKNIHKRNIKVLDASWYLPNVKRNAKKEYRERKIPGAIYFDIDDISDKKSKLPHMLPERKYFENKISSLGIHSNDILIIYCSEGLLSSPRVWWMFKYFGHKNVFVLNGGLKAWRNANGCLVRVNKNLQKSFYKTRRASSNLKITFDEIVNYKDKKKKFYILDARPRNRFLEIEPEPRKNIGTGKIDGSYNIEFSLLDRHGFLKSKNEIRNIFKKFLTEEFKIICSCGSGVSACTLAFSLSYISNYYWCIYDGSWTEWYLKTRTKN